jgi:hypothetical protein
MWRWVSREGEEGIADGDMVTVNVEKAKRNQPGDSMNPITWKHSGRTVFTVTVSMDLKSPPILK